VPAALVWPSTLGASPSDQGFSLGLLVAAAAAAVLWLVGTAGVAVARRPPAVDAAPATMDLGPEPPAIAGLLCGEYQVPAETAPAVLLDLAARGVVELDEVRPGDVVCRVEPADAVSPLSMAEEQVLDALRERAIDGVVPAAALTTGTDAASARWHRTLARNVVGDAQERGLTVDRWPKTLAGAVGAGVVPIGGLLYLAGELGGDADQHLGVAAPAAAIAIGTIVILAALTTRLGRSLAQRPTAPGRVAESRWLGVREHLRENPRIGELPPASVRLYGRHLAYAAAFGLADHAVAALPFGEEDDHLAWSPAGHRWRRVRVRYPRVRPPAWGRHPAAAIAMGLAAVALPAYALVRLSALDDLGLAAAGAVALLGIPMLWGLLVLWRAGPDLFRDRTVVGIALRCRQRQRGTSSRDRPKYWYYVAVDDGARDRIAAYRVREPLYAAVAQGETVTATVTPNLGYVRTLSSA